MAPQTNIITIFFCYSKTFLTFQSFGFVDIFNNKWVKPESGCFAGEKTNAEIYVKVPFLVKPDSQIIVLSYFQNKTKPRITLHYFRIKHPR